MPAPDTLDRENWHVIDEYEYGSDTTYTIAKRESDTPIMYVYKDSDLLGKVSFGSFGRYAECDFELSRE